MNNIRQVIGNLFQAPMEKMSFVSYMQYINTGGKISARSLLDLSTILLTYVEEQEKRNQQYEENFKEIEKILEKLLKGKYVAPVPQKPPSAAEPATTVTLFPCDQCSKVFSVPIALKGHKRSHKPKEVV